MREIKFRAWDGVAMYEPILADGRVFRDARDFEDYNDAPHDNVMQYTGLKDRNGKEIYEGDVIRHIPSAFNKQEFEGEVFWFNGHARFAMRGAHHYFDSLNSYEVIGNIYEHPHLIGGESDEDPRQEPNPPAEAGDHGGGA